MSYYIISHIIQSNSLSLSLFELRLRGFKPFREAGCAKRRGNTCYSVAEAGSKGIVCIYFRKYESTHLLSAKPFWLFYSQDLNDKVVTQSLKHNCRHLFKQTETKYSLFKRICCSHRLLSSGSLLPVGPLLSLSY